MKKSIPFGKERDDEKDSIWKGEGRLFAINKQYLMKWSIPF